MFLESTMRAQDRVCMRMIMAMHVAVQADSYVRMPRVPLVLLFQK